MDESNNGQKQKPVNVWKYGAVDGALWKKEVREDLLFYSVQLSKSYKNKNGDWQKMSVTLDEKDVANAIALLKRAEKEILK